MTTQFSCGHWATDSDDVGIPVALKRQDSAASVGQAGWMDDEVLFIDEEEMNWLRGKQ